MTNKENINLYESKESEVLIRNATESDLSKITELNDREEENKENMELQKQGKGQFIVLELSGEIIGFSFIYFEHESFHFPDREDLKGPFLEDVFIKEEFRHEGLGKLGLRKCEDVVRENGKEKIITAVELENDVSVSFHEKNGFKEVEDSRFELPTRKNDEEVGYGAYFVKELVE